MKVFWPVATALVVSISAPCTAAYDADATRFAIVCEGDAVFSNSRVQNGASRQNPTGPQIFVIDETNSAVFRALEPRQEFDPICGSNEKELAKAYISPGMVTASSFERSSDGTVTECNLEIDRKAGTAVYEMKMEFGFGGYNNFVWTMKCSRTSVPKFDKSRNKF
ncbi:hypothetical protein AB5I39_05450 [Sphingomonas sp. MMS24-J45]|uniref:hypothetical protein n=1 Tax=Sphingomonas sp. MMS24-J45 TaxID=3238806 RepID=UPI00384EA883